MAGQHHSYYPVGRPSVRWWRYICWWMLQTAMVNSFILWKNSQPAPEKKRRGKNISVFNWKSCGLCARARCLSGNVLITIIINPSTARVVGAPQMILQPVFSIIPCSPLPLGLAKLQASPFLDVVFPPLPLSALSSSPFHCAFA